MAKIPTMAQMRRRLLAWFCVFAIGCAAIPLLSDVWLLYSETTLPPHDVFSPADRNKLEGKLVHDLANPTLVTERYSNSLKLGELYREEGKFSEAEETLKQAPQFSDGHPTAALALLYSEEGKRQQAADVWQKIVEFDDARNIGFSLSGDNRRVYARYLLAANHPIHAAVVNLQGLLLRAGNFVGCALGQLTVIFSPVWQVTALIVTLAFFALKLFWNWFAFRPAVASGVKCAVLTCISNVSFPITYSWRLSALAYFNGFYSPQPRGLHDYIVSLAILLWITLMVGPVIEYAIGCVVVRKVLPATTLFGLLAGNAGALLCTWLLVHQLLIPMQLAPHFK